MVQALERRGCVEDIIDATWGTKYKDGDCELNTDVEEIIDYDCNSLTLYLS